MGPALQEVRPRCLVHRRHRQRDPAPLRAVRAQAVLLELELEAGQRIVDPALRLRGPPPLRRPLLRPEARPAPRRRRGASCCAPLHGHRHGRAHRRVLLQGRLDLAKLDALPLDLHLEVRAAEDLDEAAGEASPQIAAAIEALAGLRVPDEARRGPLFVVQVASSEARSGDVEMSRHPFGARRERVVEHVVPGGSSSADRRGCSSTADRPTRSGSRCPRPWSRSARRRRGSGRPAKARAGGPAA